jgi:hypothetical protein
MNFETEADRDSQSTFERVSFLYWSTVVGPAQEIFTCRIAGLVGPVQEIFTCRGWSSRSGTRDICLHVLIAELIYLIN